MNSARRRQIVVEVREAFHVSERRACRALGLARSSQRYHPRRRAPREALTRHIEELAASHPRFGYRRTWALLRREGWPVNLKAVRRAWRAAGPSLKGRRRAPARRTPHGQDRNGCHVCRSGGINDVWAWDVVFDRTDDGRSLKWLTLIDEHTRECLALEARRQMRADDVRGVLKEVVRRRGVPGRIRSDNGSEFVSEVLRSWIAASGFETPASWSLAV